MPVKVNTVKNENRLVHLLIPCAQCQINVNNAYKQWPQCGALLVPDKAEYLRQCDGAERLGPSSTPEVMVCVPDVERAISAVD